MRSNLTTNVRCTPNPWVSLRKLLAHPDQQGGEQKRTIGNRAGGVEKKLLLMPDKPAPFLLWCPVPGRK
jgi:hypothetical protein